MKYALVSSLVLAAASAPLAQQPFRSRWTFDVEIVVEAKERT